MACYLKWVWHPWPSERRRSDYKWSHSQKNAAIFLYERVKKQTGTELDVQSRQRSVLSVWEASVCLTELCHCVSLCLTGFNTQLWHELGTEQPNWSTRLCLHACVCVNESMWFIQHCQADSITLQYPFLQSCVTVNELHTNKNGICACTRNAALKTFRSRKTSKFYK